VNHIDHPDPSWVAYAEAETIRILTAELAERRRTRARASSEARAASTAPSATIIDLNARGNETTETLRLVTPSAPGVAVPAL
jgi:hypothetical protein